MNVKIAFDNDKRYYHDLGHDVSTTMDYGFVTPLHMRMMLPKSKAKFKLNSFVRLAPVAIPAFGRLSLKSYSRFVAFTDLLHNFESFLSATSYRGSGSSYIPTSVPYLTQKELTRFLMFFSTPTVYNYSEQNGSQGEIEFTEVYLDTSATKANVIDYITLNSQMSNCLSSFMSVPATSANSQNVTTYSDADLFFVNEQAKRIVTFKLSRSGKNLIKVFKGFGFQPGGSDQKISLFYPAAYYKAWFDQFCPLRDATWKDTTWHALFETIEQNNNSHASLITLSNLWISLASIRNCYYTSDVDFISAHIDGTAVASSTSSINVLDFNSINKTIGNSSTNQQPYSTVSPNQSYYIDSIKLRALNILTKFVNKNTAFGGKVSAYLKAHYGADYLDDNTSGYIGQSSINIEISDVMSNADTWNGQFGAASTGEVIGSYAGKGVGYGSGDTLTYTAPTFGIWVTFAAIVPQATFVQSFNPELSMTGRFDFPSSTFDALGFETSPKSIAFGCNELLESGTIDADYSTGLGNVPRYSASKVSQSILNGDMSLRSTREIMSRYTLDRYITPNDMVSDDDALYPGPTSKQNWMWRYWHPGNIVAGTFWRYVGKEEFLGNFNRIFSNIGVDEFHENYDPQMPSQNYEIFNPMADNFIVHNVIEFGVTNYLKPLSESFDTGAEEDDTFTTDKE